MTQITSRLLHKTGTRLALFAGMMVLIACAQPRTGPELARDMYPLKVKKATIAMAVKVDPNRGGVTSAGAARITAFVRDYYRRAESQMLVSTASGGKQGTVQALIDAVHTRLITAGMREVDIIVKPGIAPIGRNDVVVLSFRGTEVVVPECGDWSGTTSFDPSNTTHTNFGCAYQRNLGLMVSNPRDLIRSSPSVAPDPTRRTNVIDDFRTGAETGAEVSGEEDTGLGDD